MEAEIHINSDDYWVKVVGMLQQNWALIDSSCTGEVTVFFISDTGGVFDQISFNSETLATAALCDNGFKRYAADSDLRSFLVPPTPPFGRRDHPNGPIYSSGRFWAS